MELLALLCYMNKNQLSQTELSHLCSLSGKVLHTLICPDLGVMSQLQEEEEELCHTQQV